MEKVYELESNLNLRLVTTDFEVLYCLYQNGPTRSSDLFAQSRASPANFQIILRRLRTKGIILAQQADMDGRARVYDLSPEVRRDIEDIFDRTMGRIPLHVTGHNLVAPN